MAPAKGSKPEVNPWGWIVSTKAEDVSLYHLKKAYRVTDYKPCEDRRRNCKKNPYCCWGLGEKKWVQDPDEETEDDDYGFREQGEFAGLQNLGATCYVNSLLQLWYHNPILRPAILRWQPSSIDMSENYRPKCAIAQLQAMFARMRNSKRSKIDPTEFVTSLKLDTGEQQDAQEFSKLFFEVIVKLMTEYADGEVRNSVATAFRGELQNETECLGCHNKTRRQESFNELELGVRKNLNESLDELLKDETLSGSEQYFCSVCQKKQDAIRRTQLLSLPPVLNLQLMRFVFDRETLRKKKVTTGIQFPEVLEMTDRIYTGDSGERPAERTYQLTAVLIHNGASTTSGHYVAQIKDLTTGVWHKFNDENVNRVTKAKSQKLILKDDEGSGSDSEKKGKPGKKSKPASGPGYHNSQGAYMLVYTLDHLVQNPGQEPELWPYLQNLIQIEDESFEEELRKTKNDKDYENGLRDQRRREIAMLYPTLQVTDKTSKVESQVESEDDFQQPPRKIARSETNGCGLGKSLCKSVIQNNVEITLREPKLELRRTELSDHNNRILASKAEPNGKKELSVSPTPSKNGADHSISNGHSNSPNTIESFDMDFISADWLQQWLDSNNPPPPVENNMLVCEHGKLSPPSPGATSCLYRIVPSEFADLLYQNYNFDGPRFRGFDAMCELCVQRECQRLRALHELEDDNKAFLELNKKSDSDYTKYMKNGQESTATFLEDKCWVGKESIKNWKRLAKKQIEDEFKSAKNIEDPDEPVEVNEDGESDGSLGPLNSEIKCPHGNLDPTESARKVITLRAWSLMEKYFKDSVLMPAIGSITCPDCVNQKKENSELRNSYKEVASRQKSILIDLFHNRNRPSLEKLGTNFVISQNFVTEWKKFVKDPTRNPPVQSIENKQLLCPHEKYMYPFLYLDGVFPTRQWDLDEEMLPAKLCLVNPREWNYLSDNFSVDTPIEVIVVIPGCKEGIQYNPVVCDECAMEWWMNAYKKQFEYKNEPIYVIRRDGESPEGPSDNEEDDLFIPIPNPNKRDRKARDPMGWQNFPIGSKEAQNQAAVRRSNRPRRQKGEKMYKVSSTLKIKDLKVMILRDFKAMPSDQHLFFNNQELLNPSDTLGALEILPESKLFLKIDTATKTEDEPISTIPETGFQGTLLMGSASTPPELDPALQQIIEAEGQLSSPMME